MPKQNGNPKILAAGAAVQLLTGIPAAWGVFQKPVMAQYGFSRGQAMLSFAILVAGYGIGCAIGGFVQDQHGPRYAALWGTALLGGGSMGAALVPQGNAALFFLVYSIPAGVGSAFLAPAVLACAQKWYASRKGLATGVSGAAMGLSGAFLTVFVGFVENRWGMRVCFAALGVVVLAVCGASAAVLQNPPQPAGQPNAKAANDLPPHQMVRTTQYRLCVAGVALAAPPMLLFSPEILTIAADRGLPEQWAPLCVAVGSAASAAGRLLCPAASGPLGPQTSFVRGVCGPGGGQHRVCLCAGVVGAGGLLCADLLLLRRRGGAARLKYGPVRPCPCGGQLWLDCPWHERRQPAELCGQPAAGPACPAYAGGSQCRGGRDMFPICKTCSNG